MIVKGQIDPKFLHGDNVIYDADRQRLVIQQYAFDSFEDPPSAFYAPRSLAPSQDRGEQLTTDNISVKLFEASRGGKYWLLDRYLNLGTRTNIWPADDQNYSGSAFGSRGSIRVNFIDVSPGQASALKNNLKIAYYFKPKAPVFFIREWVQSSGGSGRKKSENVIVGELRCVLFLDGDNRLLKTIRSSLYYQPAPQPRPAPAPTAPITSLPPVTSSITAQEPSPAPQPARTPIIVQPTPQPKPKPKPKSKPKPAAAQDVASTEQTLDAPKDGRYQTGGGF